MFYRFFEWIKVCVENQGRGSTFQLFRTERESKNSCNNLENKNIVRVSVSFIRVKTRKLRNKKKNNAFPIQKNKTKKNSTNSILIFEDWSWIVAVESVF